MQRADRDDSPGFLGMNDREGDLRTRHFAEGQILLATGCPECSLDLFLWDSPPLFGLQPKAGDACPELFFFGSGLFKAWVL